MDIDFVIPWVDGSDQNWLREKNEYSPRKETENNTAARYRDWGLLPYWFRSVEKFAPWVRKVHFVTWGHLPAWLNTEAPKLHIVNHRDYIPAEYLPTFSSHCIELNFHRIPDLAERFVYFNDDMFMLRPFYEEDFFIDGLPCTYGAEVPLELQGHIGTWQHAVVNNMGVINAHFPKKAAVKSHGKKYRDSAYRWQDNVRTLALEKLFPHYFTGFANLHAPGAYRKSTFEEVWAAEAEKLDTTCRNRFRTSDDVNQWVFLWWQVASGNFAPRVIDNFVSGVGAHNVDQFCRIIEQGTHEFICINDPENLEDIDALSAKIVRAFETRLPQKSSFEK